MTRPIDAHIPGATPAVEAAASNVPSVDQAANPSRRDFLKRTAAVTAATAIGLAVPGPVFSAVRDLSQPESSQSLSDTRLQDARSRLRDLRQSHLHPITVGPAAADQARGVTSFKPGSKVDRGPENAKTVFVRVDDAWWRQQAHDLLDQVDASNVPITFLPVGDAIAAYPDVMERADRLKDNNGKKLVLWGNHTMSHEVFFDGGNGNKTADEIMRDTLPANHAWENQFLREEQNYFMGPPQGAGAEPGHGIYYEPIVDAAKRLKKAVLGWNLDTQSYLPGRTVNQIVNRVYSKVKNGSLIILHPVESGVEAEALPIWAKGLRDRGFRIGRLDELAHPTMPKAS